MGLKSKAEGVSFQIQSNPRLVAALKMYTQKRDLFLSLIEMYSIERKQMVSKSNICGTRDHGSFLSASYNVC